MRFISVHIWSLVSQINNFIDCHKFYIFSLFLCEYCFTAARIAPWAKGHRPHPTVARAPCTGRWVAAATVCRYPPARPLSSSHPGELAYTLSRTASSGHLDSIAGNFRVGSSHLSGHHVWKSQASDKSLARYKWRFVTYGAICVIRKNIRQGAPL